MYKVVKYTFDDREIEEVEFCKSFYEAEEISEELQREDYDNYYKVEWCY